MKLYDISNTADEYDFFFEGEFKVNDFPLRVEYGKSEYFKESFLLIKATGYDEDYQKFTVAKFNKYWGCISNFFQTVGFKEDDDLLLTKTCINSNKSQYKTIENLLNGEWKKKLEGKLKEKEEVM